MCLLRSAHARFAVGGCVVVLVVMVMVVVLLDYCIRRTSTNTEEPTR